MSQILLNTLKEDLDPSLVQILDTDTQLSGITEKYLLDLLINDDLLSTDIYTTTSSNSQENSSDKKRTLTEEIAELDQQHRQIDLKLASITNTNRDLIIDISEDLNSINDQIDSKLTAEIEHMLKTLKLEEVEQDAEKSKANSENMDKFNITINERLTNSIKTNNSVLSNIDSILDILEIPTLCKLCILQGNYQESLEIFMLSQTLVIRFPKLVVFRKIHDQVDRELQLMVRGLIKLLNTNLKQNNILKIFQILNKPDLINYSTSSSSDISREEKVSQKDRFLKMIYLNSRFKFITNELANLKPIIKFNKLTYLKRFIEIYREYIFNSLSIYHAIFNSKSALVEAQQKEEEDSILISQFIKNLADLLCKELDLYLPEIINPSSTDEDINIEKVSQKDGIILQILYLCRSLAKYNVDFENILAWNLCYKDPTPLVSESDWNKNISKIKKVRLD